MGWKKTVGITMLLGCTTLIPALNANAATTYKRSKQTTVASKPYYAKSATGNTYTLKGSAKKTTLKANHALKNYMSTTWTRSKTLKLTRGGKATTYYYVKNAKTGATGWVKSSSVNAGKNFQGTTAKKSSGSYQRAKAGKVYAISGNNSYVKFGKGTALSTTATYKRSKVRTIYKRGKAYQYDYVTSGKTKGWVLHSYLKAATVKQTTTKKAFGATTQVASSNGVTYYQTSGDVLSAYNGNNFKTVNVASNYVMGKPSTYGYSSTYNASNSFQTTAGTIGLLRRTNDAYSNYSFKTSVYLPIDYKDFATKAVFGDPQSATFSKDDKYLYVLYNVPDDATRPISEQTGWVIRYDWAGILKYSKNGSMDNIRRATNHYYNGNMSAQDKTILSYIKVGPQFKSGHVQSLALNPKTNQLWFIKAYKDSYTATAQRLSASTLKPNASVNFTLSSKVHMGSTLTFDNAGNAYFWTQTASTSWAPKNSVKFYKGSLGSGNVHFKLVMQGLLRAPGSTLQSVSYNPKNGRLYLVSDESIFSVPASKLGSLSASDVSATNFSGTREFESLVFKHNSNAGYLLTNKGPEIMQMVMK
ncbi:hypothetical protein [Lactiplantibacillus fabifermentans]|uniref:Extracellular protein n=2 Tax=Lactiplantibacillus fabifermentans TaxID=483011 RepID=A0A0R2NGD0_9LACO|nr:hypothetical protein [Lactiplantibacillus fabifermentans]ETY74169.1 hypothetical protein LFAB_08550 [Lactiplantibacillus fabifermentans T30PCM01]KRO24873.1 extracellular protein [Lactiplantibacillus fabifermentans DSM 21115]